MTSKVQLLLILLLFGCLPQIGSDIYTPSLPAIAKDLRTPINLIQFTMAVYLFGLAISQLFYGPFSEGIGRKPTLIMGLVIALIGSIICVLAPDINWLIAGRLVQGCGAGACAALWRSIFRDAFKGEELAKYGSYMVIFVTFIIPAAPMLGGYLQQYIGWRANFSFLLVYTVIALVVTTLLFKETNQSRHRDRLRFEFIIGAFKELLTSKIFLGYILCVFATYGAYFSMMVVSPVLLVHILGISPVVFGWLMFFGVGIAMTFGGFINGRLVERFGISNMLRSGWLLMLGSGLLTLLLWYLVGINIYVIIIPLFSFYIGATLIWPNLFAGAFTPFGHIAGYAGALYGSMQLGGGSVVGAIVSHLPENDQLPLALVMILSPLVALLIFELLVQKNQT